MTRIATEDSQADPNTELWICEVCEVIYDPKSGDPDGGISPGTAFQDIPGDWVCPVCGARKKEFRKLSPGEEFNAADVMGEFE